MSRLVVTVAVPLRDGTTYLDTVRFDGFAEAEAREAAIEMAARDESARRYLDGVDCDEVELARACRVVRCEVES